MSKTKRQIDGRTLYVLMAAAEYVYNDSIMHDDSIVVGLVTVGEIKSALQNARYVLEQVKFEVV